MKRITASQIESLYMCPARAVLPEVEEEKKSEAMEFGNRAHKYYEEGIDILDEFSHLQDAFTTNRQFLREVQLWFDPMTGKSGARLTPRGDQRNYEDFPDHYIVGTADSIGRPANPNGSPGNHLIVKDLKTSRYTLQYQKPGTNPQLVFLAFAAYRIAWSYVDRVELVTLEIVSAPRGGKKVEDFSYTMTAVELEAAFARYVYNPIAKVRTQEVVYRETGELFTNPSVQNCMFCRCDCPNRVTATSNTHGGARRDYKKWNGKSKRDPLGTKKVI